MNTASKKNTAAETIGERLWQKRHELNLTQRDISEELDVTPVMVSNWETGLNALPIRHLHKIGELLGCELQWIVDGECNNTKGVNLTLTTKEANLIYNYRKVTGTYHQVIDVLIAKLIKIQTGERK